MNPSRRTLLFGLTAAGAAGVIGCGQEDPGKTNPTGPVPAPDRAPEPPDWDPGGSHDENAFATSVQSGDATPDGVLLSVWTSEMACELVVVAAEGQGWVEVQRIGPLDPSGRAVQVELSGLQPDVAHRYVFFAADGTRRSVVGRFRTTPMVGAAPRKLVFGASSCWGSSNSEFPNLLFAADRQLDAMFLLGDTVYADGSLSMDDYRARWERVLLKEAPGALFASASVVATWDDHEVDNNFVVGTTVTEPQFDTAFSAFHEAIPMRIGPSGSGMWRVLSYGDTAEIFVLDSRGERDWDTEIVSPEQLQAMTEAIRTSTATFKLVLCSVHLTHHGQMLGEVEADDRWQGYPAQREELVRACHDTPGTIVITGDMHYSAVQLLEQPGIPGENVVEIAAGPAGSRLFPVKGILGLATVDMPQYLWAWDSWTVSLLTLDPGTGEALVEFVDDSGEVVHSYRWTP